MPKGKIYKITNIINEKIYIGCTIYNLKKRFHEHVFNALKTNLNTKLYNSMRKHGIDSFTIGLIEECDIDFIYQKEQEYIKMYDTFKNGLNSTAGGEGCLGYTHSEEIRKKISNIVKDGRSHKDKSYEEIYGDDCEKQKQIRAQKTKEYWVNLSEDKKASILKKIKNSSEKNRKFSEELIKSIKLEFEKGLTVNEVHSIYPQVSKDYLYDLKRGRRGLNL